MKYMKTNLESLLGEIQNIQKEIQNNPNNIKLYETYNNTLQQLKELDSYIFDLEDAVYSDLIRRKDYRAKNPDSEAFPIDFIDIYDSKYQYNWEYGFDLMYEYDGENHGLDLYSNAFYYAIQSIISEGQLYDYESDVFLLKRIFNVLELKDNTQERIKQLTKVKFIQVEIYILQADIAFQSKHYSDAIKYLKSAISENTTKTNIRITNLYTKVLDVLKEEQPQEYIKELAVYESISGLSS